MPKTIPNFGQIAMAARSGWKWFPELRLFVRIECRPGRHRVEIQPPTFKPETTPATSKVDDWRIQEGVILMVPALNKYMGRQKSLVFYIDDDGEEIPSGIDDSEKTMVYGEIPGGKYTPGQSIPVITKPIDKNKD